ncbi:succinate dehydrogenase assembly factor 1, mitochondrial [Cinnamomum micranthum f. kanehirae]|uniref:Succinate dehydrogenase assembly factor 1, mitochondrial n=1 Tax=Cinnamomum micranthum f. kanehirae TaxID=337451 RepID=A0A443NC71_9MAGN|nr:succinate dehydrogenase assembly factor 1, mitochondrial [Cinnamomum micranthum f. kanehirae]
MASSIRPQKLSGMQKQVLSLYRGFLRVARSKAPEERRNIESIVSAEFRNNSMSVDRKNFLYIEYLLRRGRKQLDQLKDPGISNGRRPNVRTCEEDVEASKAPNYNGFDRKAISFRPGSNPSTNKDQNSSHFATSDSLQLDNHAFKTQNNEQENCLGVDVLLQWGSRADTRVVIDESSVLGRKVIKIHRSSLCWAETAHK